MLGSAKNRLYLIQQSVIFRATRSKIASPLRLESPPATSVALAVIIQSTAFAAAIAVTRPLLVVPQSLLKGLRGDPRSIPLRSRTSTVTSLLGTCSHKPIQIPLIPLQHPRSQTRRRLAYYSTARLTMSDSFSEAQTVTELTSEAGASAVTESPNPDAPPPRPKPTKLYSWRARNPDAQLLYIRDVDIANLELDRMSTLSAVGFDQEWRPTFIKGLPENPVSLIQLASDDLVLLLQVSAMNGADSNAYFLFARNK